MNKVILILTCLAAFQPAWAQQRKIFKLVMRTTGDLVLHDGNMIPFHGYADSKTTAPILPAPTIRVNEGDTLDLEATNISQTPHTLHLYGLDANTSNDGDPLTSFELEHRQKYTYRIIARHAGTYMYHCHSTAVVNVALGMYGLIIVNAAKGLHTVWTAGPIYDIEYTWIASEMDSSWNNNPPQHDTISGTTTLPPFVPTYFLLNGKSNPIYPQVLTVLQNKAVYFRLANIGYHDHRYIFPRFLNAFIIDSDGRPLPNANRQDTVVVSPGERYGVILYPNETQTANIRLHYIDLNTAEIVGQKKIAINIISPAFDVDGLTHHDLSYTPHRYKKMVTMRSNKWITRPTTISIYNTYGILVKQMDIYIGMPFLQIDLDLSSLQPSVYSIATQIGDVKLWSQMVWQ